MNLEQFIEYKPQTKRRKSFGRKTRQTEKCDSYNSYYCRHKCPGHSMCQRDAWPEESTAISSYSDEETLESDLVRLKHLEERVLPSWRFTWGVGAKKLYEDCEELDYKLVDFDRTMKVQISSMNPLMDDTYCYYRCRKQYRLNAEDVRQDLEEAIGTMIYFLPQKVYTKLVDTEIKRRRQRCSVCKAKRLKFVREIARLWVLAHYHDKEDSEYEVDGIVYKSYKQWVQLRKAKELHTPIEWIIALDEAIDKLRTYKPKPLTLLEQLVNLRDILIKENEGIKDFLLATVADRKCREKVLETKKHITYEFGSITLKVEK